MNEILDEIKSEKTESNINTYSINSHTMFEVNMNNSQVI